MFTRYNFNTLPFDNVVICQSTDDVQIEQYPEYQVPPLQLPCLNDEKELVTIKTSEIYDLFHVERLGGMSPDIIASIRSNILQGSQFANAISKCSDDEIMETIKPRNLQSPSQLVLWSKHLQYLLEERLNKSSEPAPSGQPSSSGEPAPSGQPSSSVEPAPSGQPA